MTAFGLDLVCGADLDPNGRELAEDSIESVVQEILHRLDMRRGTLVHDDPTAGFPLASMSSRELTPADQAAIPAQVRAECLKASPRLASVTVRPLESARDRIRLSIAGTLANGRTFELTTDVTRAGLLLLGST